MFKKTETKFIVRLKLELPSRKLNRMLKTPGMAGMVHRLTMNCKLFVKFIAT